MITDVFDVAHYQHLLHTHVVLDRWELNHNFFSDPRNIALGFATDSFSPFRGKQSRKHTTWPLLLFNYNLPPEVRFHKVYLLCAGIIPGPKKPWDMDSFLFPAIQELVRLILGVSAFDMLDQSIFMLRAYLILAFGDIPAISLLLRMKGHNALVPCHMCKIVAIHNDNTKTLYVPLCNVPATVAPGSGRSYISVYATYGHALYYTLFSLLLPRCRTCTLVLSIDWDLTHCD